MNTINIKLMKTFNKYIRDLKNPVRSNSTAWSIYSPVLTSRLYN